MAKRCARVRRRRSAAGRAARARPPRRPRDRRRLGARPRRAARVARRPRRRRSRLGRPRASTPRSPPVRDVERHPEDKDATDLELALARSARPRRARRHRGRRARRSSRPLPRRTCSLLASPALAGLERRSAARRRAACSSSAASTSSTAKPAICARSCRSAGRHSACAPRDSGSRSDGETLEPGSTRGVSNGARRAVRGASRSIDGVLLAILPDPERRHR